MLAVLTTLSAVQVRACGPTPHTTRDLTGRGRVAAHRGAAMAAAPWMAADGDAQEPPMNPLSA